MRVVVCGSRSWPYRARHQVEQRLAQLPAEAIVITGGARGVDTMADRAAKALGLDRVIVPANWTRDGKGGGPIRNHRMLADQDPELVIAFRVDGYSPGTDDLIAQARRGALPLEVHRLEDEE